MQDQHRFNTKAWLLWTAGFLAFPIAGALATALTGRINNVGSALIGGMVAGAVIGAGQWLVARRLVGDPRSWIPATALAMGIGLAVGAWAVGYGTSLGELALMGAITGIPLGAAQAYLLRDRLANAWVWGAAMPLLWAIGWTVTTAGGIGVDSKIAVFWAYGAITFMALSGVLLDRLRAATSPATPALPIARTKAMAE
jgi:bacteriorhodopsin